MRIGSNTPIVIKSKIIFIKKYIKLINIQNVTNMSGMFYGCKVLTSLPDISKWDTKNVTDMSGMFYGCSTLSSLPDITKWDTLNVIDINKMFDRCSKLTYK